MQEHLETCSTGTQRARGHIRLRKIDEAGPARFPWGLARKLSAADIATARNWLIRRIADRTVEIMHRDETP